MGSVFAVVSLSTAVSLSITVDSMAMEPGWAGGATSAPAVVDALRLPLSSGESKLGRAAVVETVIGRRLYVGTSE